MLRQAVPILLVCLAALACHPKAPPRYLQDAVAEDLQHPPDQFICGLGMNAENTENALTDAKVRVANQIRSEIESVRSDILHVKVEGGNESLQREYLRESRESSSFKYNELIIPIAATYWDKYHRVYACLDRQAAAQQIMSDLQPSLKRFDDAHRIGLEAAAAANLPSFSANYRVVQQLAPEIRASLGHVQSLTQQAPAEKAAFDKKHGEMSQQASLFRSKVAITLQTTASDLPKDLEAKALGAFREAISRLGLVQENATCSASSTAYLVQVDASKRCRRGHLGPLCEPSFSLSLTECASKGVVGRYLFEDETLRVTTTRDEETTLRKSLSLLTADMLEPAVRALLETQLPLD